MLKNCIVYCLVTGKDEKWERIIIQTKPYGQTEQITSFTFENCCNYSCKYRNTEQCSVKSNYSH